LVATARNALSNFGFQEPWKTASSLNEEIRKAGKESFRSCFPAFLIQISAGSLMSAAGGDPACPCRRDVGRVSDSASSRVSEPWKSGSDFFQALENGFGLSIGGRIV
jgi:hypothetical protein